MNPTRFLLAGWAVLATAIVVNAQDSPLTAPQPTRWNAPASTIAVDTTGELNRGESFPRLDLRAETGSDAAPSAEKSSRPLASPAVTVTSSLAIVLGLFAAMVWMSRRFSSRGGGGGVIPNEVMQPLGSSSIDSRTRVTLLRCGNRILVLAQTQHGVQSLAEITDPEEVRALTASCLGEAKHSFCLDLAFA